MGQRFLAFVSIGWLLGCGGAEKMAETPATTESEEIPASSGGEALVPPGGDEPKPLELRENYPEVEGGLDPGKVQYQLRSKFGEMTACLNQTLGLEFKGKRYHFTLSFEISSFGQVSALALETPVDEIKMCRETFMQAIADINFGQSESGASTKVVYPLEVTRSVF